MVSTTHQTQRLDRRLWRLIWKGPRAVMMAVAAAFGPPKPPDPQPPVAAQVEEQR
jgi:hypothetical protein